MTKSQKLYLRNWAIVFLSALLFIALAYLGTHPFWSKFNHWLALLPITAFILSTVGMQFGVGPLGNDLAEALKEEKNNNPEYAKSKQPWE